jgi:hypothetical protein
MLIVIDCLQILQTVIVSAFHPDRSGHSFPEPYLEAQASGLLNRANAMHK